jgi:hypothetical protein
MRTSRFARATALFVAIGLVLYLLLFAAAERLVFMHGESNPMFKIATEQRPQSDWVILGASHAMPLAFGGLEQAMESETGLKIVNLAATGTGPLYQRFIFEQYLREHRTGGIVYVVDSFAFYSREWNEDRFADAKLLSRTPWDVHTLVALAGYVAHEGVDWRTWLDYATGFSKINNRDRFKPDRWEGQAQFEQSWRPSSSSVKKRIDYLYPGGAVPAELDQHLAQLRQLVSAARASGIRVVLVKLPTPAAYRARLPGEPTFDAAVARVAAENDAVWRDLSDTFDDPKLFFDSDHLNRAGVRKLFDEKLKAILIAQPFRQGELQ